MKYNPDRSVEPKVWLATDEGTRQIAVMEYHRRARIKLPNLHLHAAIHVVVENQIASPEECPAGKVLERLMKEEGLDRHEAIHCLGSVFTNFAFKISRGEAPSASNMKEEYNAALENLTAATWRASFEDDE